MYMLSERSDHLEFQLDERIYFESGQEIEEMLAISLDPDILVQSLADHVQIRGLIILRGEYQKSVVSRAEEEGDDFRKLLNYVEKVIDEDEEKARFTHRFPVEISVPHDRVEHLDDITVSVDNFDYELPANNTLRLKAAVHIYGIKQEYEHNDVKANELERDHVVKFEKMRENKRMDDEKRDVVKGKATQLDGDREFDKDDKRSNEGENIFPFEKRELRNNDRIANESEEGIKAKETTNDERVDKRAIVEATDHLDDEVYKEDKPSRHEQMFQKGEKNEEDNYLEDEQLSDPEGKETANESVEALEQEDVAETDENEAVETMQSGISQKGEIDIQLSEAETDDEEIEEVTNMTFLTQLFNTGEETYSTMKLYIVQTDDTVESIAKRYDISTLLLMKKNDIHSDTLEPGQILSIPLQNKE